MIRLMITILAFALYGYGQLPTPTPVLSNEQKKDAVEAEKKRLAEEKLLPGKPSLSLYSKHEDVFSRRWHFQIMLSGEEVLLLRNAISVSVRWDTGGFELDEKGLKILKKFFDEEMPDTRVGQSESLFNQNFIKGAFLFSPFGSDNYFKVSPDYGSKLSILDIGS